MSLPNSIRSAWKSVTLILYTKAAFMLNFARPKSAFSNVIQNAEQNAVHAYF